MLESMGKGEEEEWEKQRNLLTSLCLGITMTSFSANNVTCIAKGGSVSVGVTDGALPYAYQLFSFVLVFVFVLVLALILILLFSLFLCIW
jgi:hypothetical protein